MKKIIINGRFLSQRVTGVQRYAREICKELDKLVAPGEMEIAVPSYVTNLPDYQNIETVRVGTLKNRLWEHISFPIYVAREKGISLNLCNVAPLPAPGIVTIHDAKIKAHPEYFSKFFLLWYTILFKNETKRAKKILTGSQFSKEELIKYYDIDPARVCIIPNAWQHYERIGYDENTLNKYGIQKNQYYFSMCSLEPNKNFKWIAEVALRNPEHIFAVAGSINKMVFADGLGFDCPSNMKLLGYISDEEAKTLMRDCRAFLFPTFYEGFGIPPLEAISAGCKQVIVSDTAVMHEVFGDSVVYIDPTNYAFDIVSVTSECDQTVLAKFSWTCSAKRLYDVLCEQEGNTKEWFCNGKESL